ncbi:hypothetical protein Fcan01_03342 [Folsomia candida]|uniref:Uncharacterized protein n=1 Tax=Folsomia candida TaxID=158441 RepID=A0A226EZN9_FOLCA|nr:hypothetical protein Fcan01_03342 [Folsomia candida]
MSPKGKQLISFGVFVGVIFCFVGGARSRDISADPRWTYKNVVQSQESHLRQFATDGSRFVLKFTENDMVREVVGALGWEVLGGPLDGSILLTNSNMTSFGKQGRKKICLKW